MIKNPLSLLSRVGVCLAVPGLLAAAGCASAQFPPVPSPKPHDARLNSAMPYRVNGVTYYPRSRPRGFEQRGTASWYGSTFHGRLTSSKEVYDMYAFTAAHKSLPFNTRVRVTNLSNGRETVVRINDRGPFVENRVIDLSFASARSLGMVRQGTAPVKLTVLDGPRAAPSSPGPEFAENRYAVQVAVFRDRTKARRLQGKLENSRVQPYLRGEIQYYRVLVGRFASFDRAHDLKDKIRDRGFRDAFIVLAPGGTGRTPPGNDF